MVSTRIKNKIKRLHKVLCEKYRIDGVYLFGSHARGKALPQSDIDVCVVSKDFKGETLQTELDIKHMARSIEPLFDVLLTTPHDFKHNLVSPILDQIRRKGLRVV